VGGLLKRYRELILLAALLVVPLGVYLANAKHPSERSRIDRLVVAISVPIEKATGWVIVKALDTWSGYIALRHAHERAVVLQHAVNQLELDRLELQGVRQENERLRRLLGFAEEVAGREVVGARIIGVRLDPKGLQLVTVDRGADEGIERMMPVVVGQGVVGRVYSVASTTSDVLLLSDRNSSIAVLVDRSRARANVRGTGSPDACRLEYALRSDDMVEGDRLITSGTDGVFPRGLPVGTLVGLKRSGQGLYQRADVKPAIDVTKLEEVLIVTAFDRRVEEPPQAAAPAPPQAAAPPQPTAPPQASPPKQRRPAASRPSAAAQQGSASRRAASTASRAASTAGGDR
jgi:rod shape-determining protein MreC